MDGRHRDELLVRISERTAATDERTKAILQRLERGDERMNLHSRRLGALERWRSAVAGGIALLAALVGWKAL